jgi:hypothetical protein
LYSTIWMVGQVAEPSNQLEWCGWLVSRKCPSSTKGTMPELKICTRCKDPRKPVVAKGLCDGCRQFERRVRNKELYQDTAAASGVNRECNISLLKAYGSIMAGCYNIGIQQDDILRIKAILRPYLDTIALVMENTPQPEREQEEEKEFVAAALEGTDEEFEPTTATVEAPATPKPTIPVVASTPEPVAVVVPAASPSPVVNDMEALRNQMTSLEAKMRGPSTAKKTSAKIN